jgi:hypothetical protein
MTGMHCVQVRSKRLNQSLPSLRKALHSRYGFSCFAALPGVDSDACAENAACFVMQSALPSMIKNFEQMAAGRVLTVSFS